jgi:hypothetical protein
VNIFVGLVDLTRSNFQPLSRQSVASAAYTRPSSTQSTLKLPRTSLPQNPHRGLVGFPGALRKQLLQPQILPRRLLVLHCVALDSKRGMLVGHDIILVFRVQRLVLRRNEDFLWLKVRAGELFEEVGDARGVEVEVGGVGVAGLRG